MAYTFADLRKDVLTNVAVSPDYFGEAITYVADDIEESRTFNVHCKHSQRFIFDLENNEIVVEEITVTMSRESLPREPKSGDLVIRAGESIGYLYAYGGGDQPHWWRRVYERRRTLSKG